MEKSAAGPPGCIATITRCFFGKPKQDISHQRRSANEDIEFENLVTAENRAKATRAQQQLLTESERAHLRSGQLDRLVEEQQRADRERDAELRRQEEALRLEEEAYYAAKREAARRTQHQLPPDTQNLPVTSETAFHSDGLNPTPAVTTTTSNALQPPPWLTDNKSTLTVQDREQRDEEDFDQFLESVKARQLSITTKAVEQPPASEDEEEIDFGYWEKATLPPEPKTPPKPEADLNLL